MTAHSPTYSSSHPPRQGFHSFDFSTPFGSYESDFRPPITSSYGQLTLPPWIANCLFLVLSHHLLCNAIGILKRYWKYVMKGIALNKYRKQTTLFYK